jgi:hypothetical protein
MVAVLKVENRSADDPSTTHGTFDCRASSSGGAWEAEQGEIAGDPEVEQFQQPDCDDGLPQEPAKDMLSRRHLVHVCVLRGVFPRMPLRFECYNLARS